MYVCLFICMFAIGARTVGATELKFGMELGLYPEKVLAYVWIGRTPSPGGGGQRVLLEVRAAPTVDFLENFIKQKLKSTPDIVGAGQVKSGLGPHPGVRRPVQVQGEGLLPWSLGRLS